MPKRCWNKLTTDTDDGPCAAEWCSFCGPTYCNKDTEGAEKARQKYALYIKSCGKCKVVEQHELCCAVIDGQNWLDVNQEATAEEIRTHHKATQKRCAPLLERNDLAKEARRRFSSYLESVMRNAKRYVVPEPDMQQIVLATTKGRSWLDGCPDANWDDIREYHKKYQTICQPILDKWAPPPPPQRPVPVLHDGSDDFSSTDDASIDAFAFLAAADVAAMRTASRGHLGLFNEFVCNDEPNATAIVDE